MKFSISPAMQPNRRTIYSWLIKSNELLSTAVTKDNTHNEGGKRTNSEWANNGHVHTYILLTDDDDENDEDPIPCTAHTNRTTARDF